MSTDLRQFFRYIQATRERECFAFLIATFILTWAVWVPCLIASHKHEYAGDLLVLGAYGPAVAALLLSYRGTGIQGFTLWPRLACFGTTLLVCWLVFVLHARFWDEAQLSLWMKALMLLPAAIPAWIVSAALSRDGGVRATMRSLLPQGRTIWHGVALFLFPVLLLITALVARMRGDALIRPNVAGMRPSYGVLIVVEFGFAFFFGGGVSEEPGWRGFLLTRLQERFSPLTASLFVWLPWALWHAPLDYAGYAGETVTAYLRSRVPNLRAIKAFEPLVTCKLEEITTEKVAEFAAHRQAKGLQVSSVNSSLRVLRRVLRLAVEWSAAPSAPKLKLLRGERQRERVISPKEEARYLAAAPDLLASIVTILADTGMRPEECSRLRWESITWTNGRHGTVLVTHGKTSAARRVLPLTPRVRTVLETRWEDANKPDEGWVFTAPTKSGHIEKSTLKKRHKRVFETLEEEAKKNQERPVRAFVLYDLRHTFLTRLGESGCDVWTLARVAGHSNIKQSSRYVHPSGDAVLDAMERLGGHKIGHSEEKPVQRANTNRQLTQ